MTASQREREGGREQRRGDPKEDRRRKKKLQMKAAASCDLFCVRGQKGPQIDAKRNAKSNQKIDFVHANDSMFRFRFPSF